VDLDTRREVHQVIFELRLRLRWRLWLG